MHQLHLQHAAYMAPLKFEYIYIYIYIYTYIHNQKWEDAREYCKATMIYII
jgi:hypothetical protein